MSVYVIFSWLFALALLAAELMRRRSAVRIDFLTAISLAFAIVFVAAPSILYLTPPDSTAFLKFTWMRSLPTSAELYSDVSATVAGAYVCICFGYLSSTSIKAEHCHAIDESPRAYLVAGCAFLVFGVIAFIAFLEIVGGPAYAFKHAWRLRTGTPDLGVATNFAFVKRLALLTSPGSVFLIQAESRATEKRIAYILLACVGVFAALLVLVFMQGRLLLAAYVVPILLALWTARRRGSLQYQILSACSVAAIFVTIYGVGQLTKPMSLIVMELAPPKTSGPKTTPGAAGSEATPNVSPDTTKAAKEAAPVVGNSLPDKISQIALEFAFPFVNLAAVITRVPSDVGYRWYEDLLLPFLHLVPKRLIPIGEYLPPKLFEVNTRLQVGNVPWGVPVDLISFGWFSSGFVGVLVVGFAFGWLVRRIEISMPSGNLGDEVFRISWMVILSALVMYGDPNWVIVEMFHWNVALLVYLAIRSRAKKRSQVFGST
jgi:hypothetical protein